MMVMGDGPPKERGRHRSKVENDIISRRERDFRHQQMWTGAVDYYKRWDKINTKFDEWTSPRYYEDNNKMLGDLRSKRDQEELLGKRRSKLRQLLEEEQRSYEIEVMVKKNMEVTNKPGRNNEGEVELLKEVTSELKHRDEEKRKREAELKLYHQWRINNPIVRQYENKFKIKDLKLSWLDQQIEKRMQKEKEEKECRELLKQQEERLKQEKLIDEKRTREIEEKRIQLKDNLDKQIQELKEIQKVSDELKCKELDEIRHEKKVISLEEFVKEDEKRRNAKECALYNIKQHKLKLKQKALNIQENLAKEQELLLRMKRLELEDLIQDQIKKKEIKAGLQEFLSIIREQEDLERRRQKHLEFIFESEAKAVYDKQLEIWNREEACRKALLKEVMDTVKCQISDNLKQNKEKQMELLQEREEMTDKIEQYDKELHALKQEEENNKQRRRITLEEEIKLKTVRKKQEENVKLKEINEELERVRIEEERLQKEILEMQRKRGSLRPPHRSRLFY